MQGRLRNQTTSKDHPHFSITKIAQNTEKSPGNLRILSVIQIPVRNHQLILLWKTLKGVIILKLKESEKKDKYQDLARELKKIVEHESDVYNNCDWCSHQRIIKGTGGLRNKRTSGEHPNYYIIENDRNTEEGPGDLRRLAVTQISV